MAGDLEEPQMKCLFSSNQKSGFSHGASFWVPHGRL